MHKSHDELHNQLESARQKVAVGAVYAHYKHPNQLYKVLHVAVTEWNDELCVIYQAQYDTELIFVRPLASWLETVEWQGKSVLRFTKVDK